MTSSFLSKYDSIIVGTGNILDNEEFKKAKNPTQEVSSCESEHLRCQQRDKEIKRTS